ncbi:hypothetical protein [Nonomuraea sp. NPDC049480]|uniref:hypothetical protein n=1 Tax=Nonomuraea sp. NPDC049480 TaxID=3364353 RepID=UPI0037B1A8CC
MALGSLQEELARRLTESRRRIVELREQLAEVQSRLDAEEDRLSRLVITQETVEEILGESASPAAEPVPASEGVDAETQEGGPEAGLRGRQAGEQPVEVGRRGVVTVPSWEPELHPSVLPRAYRDVLEVLADAGGAMRAGKISMAVERGESAAKVERECCGSCPE